VQILHLAALPSPPRTALHAGLCSGGKAGRPGGRAALSEALRRRFRILLLGDDGAPLLVV